MGGYGLQDERLCRICADVSDDFLDIFHEDENEGSLRKKLSFYLPLEIKAQCPFPKKVCVECVKNFENFVFFFQKLNKGQMKLAEILKSKEDIAIAVPDWLTMKKSIFRVKYPCDGNKIPPPKPPRRRRTATMAVQDVENIQTGKRARRVPQRLQESLRGMDLENVCRKEPQKDVCHSTACVKCLKCDKSFTNDSKLKQHMNTVHMDVVIKCKDCHETYRIKEDLILHQKETNHVDFENVKIEKSEESETTSSKYECRDCGKVFNATSTLYYHSDSVHKKDYQCTLCNSTFKNRQLLSRHLTGFHSEVRPHSCEFCDQKFKTSATLKIHLLTHRSEKRFSCEVCGKMFSYKASLTQHIRLHSGDKPYKCEHCGKQFAQAGNLKEHVRTHTGDKPFDCGICGRKFTTSSQHRLHEKRHKGEKPWKCELCPKAFLHKDSYAAHIRRHKGDKPYQCDVCKKLFTEACALKRHKGLHSGEKPYLCHICKKSFTDCSNYAKHRRIHEKSLLESSINSFEEERQENVPNENTHVWKLFNQASGSTIEDQSDDKLEKDKNIQQIVYLSYDCDELQDPAIIDSTKSQETIDLGSLSSMHLQEVVDQHSMLNASHGMKSSGVELTSSIIQPIQLDNNGQPDCIQINMLDHGSSQPRTIRLDGPSQEKSTVDDGVYIEVKLKDSDRPIRIEVPPNFNSEFSD